MPGKGCASCEIAFHVLASLHLARLLTNLRMLKCPSYQFPAIGSVIRSDLMKGGQSEGTKSTHSCVEW